MVYHGVALFLYLASSVNLLVVVSGYRRHVSGDAVLAAGVSLNLYQFFSFLFVFSFFGLRLRPLLALVSFKKTHLHSLTHTHTHTHTQLHMNVSNCEDAGSSGTSKCPLHNRVRLPHLGACVS